MLNHPTRNPYETTSHFSGTDRNHSSGLDKFLMLSLLITTSGRAPLDPLDRLNTGEGQHIVREVAV